MFRQRWRSAILDVVGDDYEIWNCGIEAAVAEPGRM